MIRLTLGALLALALTGCALTPEQFNTLRGYQGGYDVRAENERQAAWRERQSASFDRMMRGGL